MATCATYEGRCSYAIRLHALALSRTHSRVHARHSTESSINGRAVALRNISLRGRARGMKVFKVPTHTHTHTSTLPPIGTITTSPPPQPHIYAVDSTGLLALCKHTHAVEAKVLEVCGLPACCLLTTTPLYCFHCSADGMRCVREHAHAGSGARAWAAAVCVCAWRRRLRRATDSTRLTLEGGMGERVIEVVVLT